MRIPDLRVDASGVAIVGMVDLASAMEQWGAATWTMIEEHLVRVVLVTMDVSSQMIVRIGLNLEEGELLILFQYADLREDLAQVLFDVFGDLDPAPALVGRVPVQRGWYPLLAGIGGEACFLVDSVVEPTLGIAHTEGDVLRWENRPFPLEELVLSEDGAPVLPYTLHRFEQVGPMGSLHTDEVVGLRVAALVEV